jgi:photosystem II stability/assembly factor-like uncharacterized protein
MKQFYDEFMHKQLLYLCFILVCVSFICSAQQQWTTQSSPTHCNLYGITWGNNTFVAVGDSGKILSSPDAITWTTRNSGTTNGLISVAWGTNKFLAVGINNVILSSPDGITWTILNAGIFSPDNIRSLNSIVFGSVNFIVAGTEGYFSQYIPTGSIYFFTDVRYGLILYKSFFPSSICSAAFGANENVITGTSSTGLEFTPDGTNWYTYSSTKYLNWVSWCKNCFIVVGNQGTIINSSLASNANQLIWTQQSSGSTRTLNFVTYGANTNVIVGDSGTILTAPDSVTWTSRTSGTTRNLKSVVYGNNKFVAVGNSGTILTSINSAGTLPQQKTSGSINNLRIYNKQIYYSLSSSANAVVQVFNTQGQLIRTLLNAWKEQGNYILSMPATINNGRYIISYKAGAFTTNKIVVINN